MISPVLTSKGSNIVHQLHPSMQPGHETCSSLSRIIRMMDRNQLCSHGRKYKQNNQDQR